MKCPDISRMTRLTDVAYLGRTVYLENIKGYRPLVAGDRIVLEGNVLIR